jgi:hypothetical protein
MQIAPLDLPFQMYVFFFWYVVFSQKNPALNQTLTLTINPKHQIGGLVCKQ